jgi:hypothetical protein
VFRVFLTISTEGGYGMGREEKKPTKPPELAALCAPEMSADGLPSIETWGDEIATEWGAEELSQPYDENATWGKQIDHIEKTYTRTAAKRLFVDYRADPKAYKQLAELPTKNGQTLHAVISGTYALWQLVPALVERSGDTIDELLIATLSFSKQNAAEILGLIDGGQVKSFGLLVSKYFKCANRHIYDCLVPQLHERKQPACAMRIHCKIILLKMTRGEAYTVESSANLRSSGNVEQFCLTRCPKLHAFHRAWIREELERGSAAAEGDE